MAMFNGANHVVVNGGLFVANAGSSPKGFDKFIQEVAPNAILNAGGRADEVRCFPGTREEVIGKLEKFMNDNSPDKKRMMWLSGPAGAGKSAICQTVAERCSEQGRQAVNFFFFHGDSTRSHSKPLVATLVYQLRLLYPALDGPLFDYLEKDPLICNTSIENQFKRLISSPVQKIQESTSTQQQIGIIVDGLDECNGERDQDQILTALHTLAHVEDSPFLILVSSRAEPHLVMSFNRLGSSVQSMFLDNKYKPEKDIRLFVVAKFAEIKRNHHLARTLQKEWPTDADVNAITHKSSGQFIYAATVMRYIQFSSENPALTLATILAMSPPTNHNPFAQLDAVYSHIFSKARNIRAVQLILFARNCTKQTEEPLRETYKFSPSVYFVLTLQLVGYTHIEVESVFADLAAIIKVVPGSQPQSSGIEFYHASLEDYLYDKSRSSIYYVHENDIAAEFSSICLRSIDDIWSIRYIIDPLRWVQKPTPELSKSLLDASTRYLNGDEDVPFLGELIGQIERVYWDQDKVQFKALLRSWIRFAYKNNTHKVGVFFQVTDRYKVPWPLNPLASRYYKQYCITEGVKYALRMYR